MSLLDRVYDSVENWVLERVPNNKFIVEAEARRGGGDPLSQQMVTSAKVMAEKSLLDWKRGIASATDPDNPDWSILAGLHENLLIDDHLESVIESRIAYTKRSAIKFVNTKKVENPEITELFERPWYEELVEIVVGHRFKGRRMIELYELNDDNELETVTEIFQPYFNTKKRIILKNPGDTTGWSYAKGSVFEDNYVQVGKDNDLGMLTKMAPIVLAKKLGMGSWLDYIDKYGIPPLFITTDREDKERLNQLWAAASKFKSNNFMVGRGQEKFEVGNIGGAGIAPFEALLNRADSMLSKRVLGGTSMTDEKSFVGSAEIQFKMAIDRFESDRLFFKYFFNTKIRPRLIKLSPVYAPLKDYKLEYDDTERLTIMQRIDIILKLAALFQIDPAQITELTGINILGLVQQANNPAPAGEAPAKK